MLYGFQMARVEPESKVNTLTDRMVTFPTMLLSFEQIWLLSLLHRMVSNRSYSPEKAGIVIRMP